MNSAPVVLLTDFGWADHYAGLLKAVILSIHPKACITDLSHGIEPQNVAHGASLLEISYGFFPKGSVFVCVVDPGVGTGRKILCVKTEKYFFLAPDNGLLSLVLLHETRTVIRAVENHRFFRERTPSYTFHGRDIFSPVGAHLAKSGGAIFSKLGPTLQRIQPLDLPGVRKFSKRLEGAIVYFDHFGNAITRIHRRDAGPAFWKRAEITVNHIRLGALAKTYGSRSSSPVALFNSSSQLEIALPGGSFKAKYGVQKGDPVKAVVA